MYYDNYIDYEDQQMDKFIENEMARVKQQALKTISSSAHFKTESSNESFITMFVYCWHDSVPAAENLSDELDLCKLDFIALTDDFDAFKEEFLKNYEMAQNF